MDVVITTNLTHIINIEKTIKSIVKFFPQSRVIIITRKDYFILLQKLPYNLVLIDENSVIPDMTLNDLKKLKLPHFPNRAGWYFQQLLKWGTVFYKGISDYYLIWDSDTILLRPIELFDEEGRIYFTKAMEYHRPYFENFERIMGFPAKREFSFIAQHMLIDTKILKEMLAYIESRHPYEKNWAWAIMNSLAGENGSLFSEYEFYGHYIKEHYPEKCHFREIPWTREGTKLVGPFPSELDLKKLAENFFYAAFELRPKNFKDKFQIKLRLQLHYMKFLKEKLLMKIKQNN